MDSAAGEGAAVEAAFLLAPDRSLGEDETDGDRLERCGLINQPAEALAERFDLHGSGGRCGVDRCRVARESVTARPGCVKRRRPTPGGATLDVAKARVPGRGTVVVSGRLRSAFEKQTTTMHGLKASSRGILEDGRGLEDGWGAGHEQPKT